MLEKSMEIHKFFPRKPQLDAATGGDWLESAGFRAGFSYGFKGFFKNS
jgi:hypothetical protein